MKLSTEGVNVLVAREALRTEAYLDSAGHWTIGVGHTSGAGEPDVYQGKKITKEEALDILRRDVKEFEDAVNATVKVPLTQNEFDALVSFCFNIGVSGFQRSSVVKRLNAGDKDRAAQAILSWKKPPEIMSRRRGEQQEFALGRYQARVA